jgi:hypothetical protein
MRPLLSGIAIVSLIACAPRAPLPRKDKPMVTRIAPNGYELEEISSNFFGDKTLIRRECSIVAITGSHIPSMVCVIPEEEASDRGHLLEDMLQSHPCRDQLKCVGMPP